MAMSATRALLTAHLQATWNRTLRETGKGGTVALVLLLLALTLLVLVPALGGAVGLGYLLGSRLDAPYTTPLLGFLLFGGSIGMGLVGGIVGGPKALTWESYRLFPLRLRQLFVAELVAGLGETLTLLVVLVQGAGLVGLGVARPGLAGALVLLWILQAVALLSVQHLVGGLAALLVKRLRVALVVVGVTFWILTSLGPTLLLGNARAREARFAKGGMEPAQVEVLRGAAEAGARMMALLPQGQAALGLRDMASGRPGLGWVRQLALVATVGLLALGAARTLAWENEPQAFRPEPGAKDLRLWSFGGPISGLARLAFKTVLGSHFGKFGFIMPLMTLVIIKGPFGQVRGQALWSIPGAFFYLSLTGSQMLFNQFGFYGHGIKALLLLPVTPRQLLLGQAFGFARYMGLQAALLMLLLSALSRPSPAMLGAGLLLSAGLFFLQAAVGAWTSVAMPRAIPLDSLKSGGVPFVMVLVGLGTSFAGALVFGGAFLLCGWLAPRLLLPVMAALALLSAGAYWFLLPGAAAFLALKREKLVEALG